MKRSGVTYSLAVACVIALTAGAPADTRYREVAVIINRASPVSIAIGEYFAAARGIPGVNIIRVNAPTSEVITDAQFRILRSDIESALIAAGIADSVNYLVTTKGMPLKIDRGNIGMSYSTSASVEGELVCILGPLSPYIASGTKCFSPYYGAEVPFTRSRFGIYLVTRLDGYTFEDVTALIDRSGPNLPPNAVAPFVFDKDLDWAQDYEPLNNSLDSAAGILRVRGRIVLLNADSLFVTHQINIAGYVSWGSNDHHALEFAVDAIPENTWSRGAIAETYVSSSARSFDSPPLYGQSLIADLIHEGASGAKGYVYEPFISAMASARILFSRYTAGANLAESYYAASRYLSWMDVVIGDPLTGYSDSQGSLPIQLSSFRAAYDAPSGGIIVDWVTFSETNSFGFMVQRSRVDAGGVFVDLAGGFVSGAGTTIAQHSYVSTSLPGAPGRYEYRLRQIDLDGSITYSEARAVVVPAITRVAEGSLHPRNSGLEQNYPNPFNPSTAITYRLSEGGDVHVAIYDLLGREVATLVRGRQEAGVHTIRWDASAVGAGVYLCRLQSGPATWIVKLISLK